jgi:hypothetical protein
MTERTREYAFFSDQAYSLASTQAQVEVDGQRFDVISRADNPNTGFYAAAFQSRRDGHTVIAFRGTNDLPDGVVDAAMVATRLNIQTFESEVFTANVIQQVTTHSPPGAPAEVTVTGHSLGGGLAQLNAERFGLRGETFNAYGTVGLLSHEKEGGAQMLNHVRAGDPVSAASRHFGDVRVYATSEDVRNIEQAGYGYDRGFHPGRMVVATSPSAHYMSNFIDTGNGSIINDQAEALYRTHREAIDQYRGDLRTSRELATTTLSHPGDAGLAAAGVIGITQVGMAAAMALEVQRDIGRAAHTVERGAEWTAHAATEALAPPGTTATIFGSTTGSAELDRRVRAASISDDGHPGNAMYRQALHGIEQIDGQHGRATDSLSRNLAAALAVEGRREGLDRIDHVVLSEDASRAFAVQGEINSPFKTIASVQTELGIAKSIESSSHEWTQAQNAASQAQKQSLPDVQINQSAPRHHGL